MVEASHSTIRNGSSPSRGRNSASAPGLRKQRMPERTREEILQAAIAEFSDKGLGGARVDVIARRAAANKRMIYHYFRSKEALFLAVLERTYDDIRRDEAALKLEKLDPASGMRRLVEFSFGYFTDHPHFIRLLNSENLHGARHLKKSQRIREMNSPLIEMIRRILLRGEREGAFRARIDPVQLYISIAALGYFYFANIHTLSTVFGRDLSSPRLVQERRRHAVDMVLGYIRR
jgi:TetR/AcrR family transcriptional regulator